MKYETKRSQELCSGDYRAPEVRVSDIAVEEGFAASASSDIGGGMNGFGDGGTVEW